ncbi:cytochrome P450 [Aspergillus carlsbadensis]|nr:cytochrome P450 [Aspergillus carlsbadensis]
MLAELVNTITSPNRPPGSAVLVLLTLVLVGYLFLGRKTRLPNVPTLKISSRPGGLGAADDAATYMSNMMRVLQAGYNKYSRHGQNYLLRTPSGLELVVAPKFLEEIRRAPESHVSNLAANNEIMQVGHTLHPRLMWDQYHFDAPIRKSLTQSLGPKLPDIVEEAKLSLEDTVGSPAGWSSHAMHPLAFTTVTRTANRLLFGPDLARNPEFTTLSIEYTTTMFGGAQTIRHLPELLKPLAMWWKTGIYKQQAIARKHLIPSLTQRIADEDLYRREGRTDEWARVKAEDVIQWVLDVTPATERVPDRLVYRMLHINVAAVHTSSVNFLDAMHCLAMMPRIHEDLREEIERVFRVEGGWTKQALTYLVKLDSFMHEVARLCVSSAVKMKRKTIKDWHLSDGTLVPKGTTMAMNHSPVVLDAGTFENPHTFDPYRMYRKRQEEGKANQYQFVMTSDTNLNFGHGKHACPGRFFAANEIKTLLVLMLMRYEFEAEYPAGLEGIIQGEWYGESRSPVRDVDVRFRGRRSEVPEDLAVFF